MRKRGRQIRHRNAMIPGLIAQAACPEYETRLRFGATGEELKAIQLLAEVSLDYWNRRSGALFHFACEQLRALRAEQSNQFKEEQKQERKAA